MKENNNYERAVDTFTFEDMAKFYIETAKENLILDTLVKYIKEMCKLETSREAAKYVYASLKHCEVEAAIVDRCKYLVKNPEIMEDTLNG